MHSKSFMRTLIGEVEFHLCGDGDGCHTFLFSSNVKEFRAKMLMPTQCRDILMN